jgi:hypothetical protein
MTEPLPRPIPGIPGSGGCVVPARPTDATQALAPARVYGEQVTLPGLDLPDAQRGMKWLGLAAGSLSRAELGSYEVDNALGQIAAATPIVDAYLRSSDRKSVVMDNLLNHSLQLAQLHGRVLGGEQHVTDARLIRDLKIDALTALNLMQDPDNVRTRPIS